MMNIGHRVSPLIALPFLNVGHVELFKEQRGDFGHLLKIPRPRPLRG